MKIAVLGAGMVGRAIARDLSIDFPVTSFDFSADNLQLLRSADDKIETIECDLRDYFRYEEMLEPFELVVSAVPGHMGYKTLEAIIQAGKNVVDISFFPEEVLQLDELAKKRGVTAIPDCGVAPGMSNLLLGRYNEEMQIDSFACYVGGLPFEKKPPFQYKAPFSPVDVLQEYFRPARFVEAGKMVTKPAMSDRELIYFEKAGTLEAFNTDGLRSLIHTMSHIPELKEKTLRYPGHIDLIIALQQAGFFDNQPVCTDGIEVVPLNFTSNLLVRLWKLEPDEAEFTVMKVIIKGEGQTVEYELYDAFDPLTKTSSMARTTGYTCTAAVQLIAKGLFTEKGICPPEVIGKNKSCFEFIIQHLAARNVIWTKKVVA